MTYYGTKELANAFRTVRKNTIQIAEEIGEENYGFRPAPETRTVGQTLVHIAVVTRLSLQIHAVERRTKMEGFDFMTFFGNMLAEEQVPRSKAEIVKLLHEEGDRYAKWLDTLNEEGLAENITMPPGMTPASKSRFEMILGAKEHEMHHRAQLMTMERILGITPHLTRQMQERIAAATAAAGQKSK